MYLRILIGLLFGFGMGLAFYHLRLRNGLTKTEWDYYKAFLDALRDGSYTIKETDDETEE